MIPSAPDEALCDGPQALTPEEVAELGDQLRALAEILGRPLA